MIFFDIFNARVQELYEYYQRSKQVLGLLTRYETPPITHSSTSPASKATSIPVQRSVNAMYTRETDDEPPDTNSMTLEDSSYCSHCDHRHYQDCYGTTHNVMALDHKDSSTEKKTYGCLNMAAFSKCPSQYCKKSHKEADVAAAARYSLTVFQNSPYNAPGYQPNSPSPN